MPGAQVVVTNQDTGLAQTAKTSQTGEFVIPSVLSMVTVKAQSFRNSRLKI